MKAMPKVVIIDTCLECPYSNASSFFEDCRKFKKHNEDFPDIPSWCRLDGIDEIAWDQAIEEAKRG